MSDSGNHSVNIDEAVLSGKVFFQGVEYVLLLLPGVLICREFATETRGFTLPLDKITGCVADKSRSSEFHISAMVPRTLVDPVLVQANYHVKCNGKEEVDEWVETLQSVVTDRNIRAIEEQKKTADRQASELDDAIGQLISIFPGIDLDVINTILQANGGNVQRAIDSLLGMSDPAFSQPPAAQNPHTTTPQDQLDLDEQLAKALQDELFLQQVQNDENLRRHISGEEQEFSISDKLQEMSDATKKAFGDLYHKFKKATERSGAIELTGEEMKSIPKGSFQAQSSRHDNGSEQDDEDEVPLERGNKLFSDRKGAYTQVAGNDDTEKLYAGGSSTRDDDDGL